MTNKPIKQALDWLYSTQHFGIKLGLENIEKLLAEFLVYPAHGTKIIQVAGTNGKGSTCAFMESIARAHGIKAGLFTSPHLISFNERIRVYGEPVPDHELANILFELKDLVSDWENHPTFFELSLAAAMRYFKDAECELIILETGMGGRLDATSAIPKDLAVITPIGMDHMEYLGNTIEEIAQEKAAIMREAKPCLSAPQSPELEHTLSVHANLTRCEIGFVRSPLEGYDIALAGPHQKVNAALATEALSTVIGNLRYDAVAQGVKSVEWPGRFQQIRHDQGITVVDCCHNEHSARSLINTWQETFGDKKAHLVFSAARDKTIHTVLEILLPICQSVEVYEMKNSRTESAETLRKLVSSLSSEIPVTTCESLESTKKAPLSLITGSLFLAGEWLELARAKAC